jgi:Zn-dependent protease
MALRANLSLQREISDIVIADLVLIIAFSIALIGGLAAFQSSKSLGQFVTLLPVVAIGVSLSFIIHELMHKFVAQKYGALAEFKILPSGLFITALSSMFGFLLGMPGATFIYTNSFTKKENGIVSIAGPLTNFAVFGIMFVIARVFNPPQNSFLSNVVSFTLLISIILAFFNMLPIFPLDGSKVFDWDKRIYGAVMGVIFILLLYVYWPQWIVVLYLIIFAIVISFIVRAMSLFRIAI